jgi:hypothetical protein
MLNRYLTRIMHQNIVYIYLLTPIYPNPNPNINNKDKAHDSSRYYRPLHKKISINHYQKKKKISIIG